MKRDFSKIMITFTLIFLTASSVAHALSVETHQALNKKLAQGTWNGFSLDNYLKSNLGLSQGVNEYFINRKVFTWFSDGGYYEDKPAWYMPYLRSVNHFHNPLAPSLNQAGFTGIWGTGLLSGKSAILWSQNAKSTQSPGGYYSWYDARDYFYGALTSSDQTMRNINFANTFRGLGQLMHLVQDMSVPEHARNDGHYLDAYEEWVRDSPSSTDPQRSAILDTALANPVFFSMTALVQPSAFGTAAPIPIANLFDTKQYNGTNPSVTMNQNIGLSEYSNANFISDDTLFKNFRYPSKTSSVITQDYIIQDPVYPGSTVTREYYKKTADGDSGYRLAGVGYLALYLETTDPTASYAIIPPMDGNVYGDYAQRLLPRAVGYSAGLLNYFFRGSIQLSLPDGGMYASADNAGSGFTTVKVLAKNTTPNEDMPDGSIELVVKYKLALEDPFKNYPEDYFIDVSDFKYIVAPEKNGIRAIPSNSSVELTFDLPTPIPLWAVDVYLQVVYHGKLGNEDNAVAVGFKDISEPTPIDLSSDTDRICMNGSFYTAGSPEAISLVDANHNGIADEWDVYSHSLKDIYIKISPQAAQKYATPADYSFYIPSLVSGGFSRKFYILSDEHFSYSSLETWVNDDPKDPWVPLPDPASIYIGTSVKNQTDYVTDSNQCAPLNAPCYVWWHPKFFLYRDREEWWGTGYLYINNAYPDGSECSCYSGVFDMCEPGQIIKPDLIMTVVSGPTTGSPGTSITVSNTVKNQGNANAASSTIGIYLSTDPVITTADIRIGTRSVTLAAGAENAANTSITVPSTTPPGTYYLGAIADYTNVVSESDETNNALTGNQININQADLIMTVVSGPASAGPGSSITVANTIKNQGSGNAPSSTIGIYLSTDPVITTTDTRIGTRAVTLAAGAESAANTSVTIPSTTPAGTYYLGAIADYTNVVPESNETNNALTGNQIEISQADLVMTVVSGPANGSPGTSITVANTIKNQGSGSAGSSTIGIYLSPTPVITTSNTRIGTRTVSSLAAGAESAASTTVTVPSTTPPGTYYLGAIADYTNTVPESDEANNALAGNQIEIVQADLIMTVVSGPASGSPGTSITVANTIKNQGSGSAPSSTIGIYLSTDPVITTTDIRIGTRSAAVAAGAESAANTTVTVPSTTPPGIYYLGAIADYTNVVPESDETNNALVGNQIEISQADLVMTVVSGPTTGSPGTSITVANTVKNQGTGNAPSSTVGIYLSTDPVITTADTRIGTRSVTLAAGAESTANTTMTIPSATLPGTYYLGAIADYTNVVSESDETNNALTGNQINIQ